MVVKQVVNSVFTSNTYIISKAKHNWVWLVDIGDFEKVFKELPKDSIVKGVFITHPHFDHIYGINKLIDLQPNCTVYTSEHGKNGLFSDKLNLSYYHQEPIEFMGSKIQILCEDSKIELYENSYLEVLETPGHDWGCLTYKVDNYLFTGDSYIPNVKVVTKLKGGDKEESLKSLKKIMNNISKKTIVCPGHGNIVSENE